MERLALLAKIETVAPALAGNSLIPILNKFWFTGKEVMAFNDQIAISTPLKTDFIGAAPASLLDILKNSRAKECELEPTDGSLKVKLASSKLNMALQPESEFIHEQPTPTGTPLFDAKSIKPFIKAMNDVLRSVGHDASVPEQLGITIIPNEDALDLYTTNDATMSRATVKASGKLKERIILLTEFCKQVAALASDDCALYIGADYALFVSGKTRLFSKLIHSDNPLAIAQTVKACFGNEEKKKLVAVPTKMELILERAVIIAASRMQPSTTSIQVKDGKMHFHTASEKGEVSDVLSLDGAHPPVSIRVDPALMKIGYGGADKMLVTPRAVIMTKGQSVMLISIVQG